MFKLIDSILQELAEEDAAWGQERGNGEPLRMEAKAKAILQCVSETFMGQLFADGHVIRHARKRTTLCISDVQIVKRLRGQT